MEKVGEEEGELQKMNILNKKSFLIEAKSIFLIFLRSFFWSNIKSNRHNPAGYYMFKVNNRNTRTSCEICSKLTIKTPERCHWRRSGFFIVNFEHISHLVLVFLLLTLSR